MALKASVGGSRSGLLRFNADKTRRSLKAVLAKFDKVIKSIDDATIPAVRSALQPIHDAAVAYCPIDTGALRESSYLEVRRENGKIVAEIGFARGGRPAYAAQVHEDLGVFHKPPTQAKYLQRALEEQLDKIPERIADKLRRKIRSST